jgi:hypothetical protein
MTCIIYMCLYVSIFSLLSMMVDALFFFMKEKFSVIKPKKKVIGGAHIYRLYNSL